MITVEPMDRRDFLWRLWIGAAFALAGIPLLGDVLREWAASQQRKVPHDSLTRTATFGWGEWRVGDRIALGGRHGTVVGIDRGILVKWAAERDPHFRNGKWSVEGRSGFRQWLG